MPGGASRVTVDLAVAQQLQLVLHLHREGVDVVGGHDVGLDRFHERLPVHRRPAPPRNRSPDRRRSRRSRRRTPRRRCTARARRRRAGTAGPGRPPRWGPRPRRPARRRGPRRRWRRRHPRRPAPRPPPSPRARPRARPAGRARPGEGAHHRSVVAGAGEGGRRWVAGRAAGRASPAAACAGRPAATAAPCPTLPPAARTISRPGSPCPYGPSPVAANSRVAPSEKTSEAGETGSPRACSGAMKPGVPTTMPATVRPWVWSRLRATPKSARHGSPRSSNRMLAGLMSRWTMPARWAEDNAPSRRRACRSTSSAGAGPCWATRSARLPPDMYGMTSTISSPSSITSSRPTTFGWCSLRRTSASRRRRCRDRAISLAEPVSVSRLSATLLPFSSRARSTTPMPPRPSRAIRS